MLRELTIKDLQKFARDNKLKQILSVTYRTNNLENVPADCKYIVEPDSIDITVLSEKGNELTYTFSKHGLANIKQGRKKLYKFDSEEQFSSDNGELFSLTYNFVKLLASKGNPKYIHEELAYRRKLYNAAEEIRATHAPLKNMYKKYIENFEKKGQTDTNTYKVYLKHYEYNTELSERASKAKLIHGKCMRYLESQVEDQK